MTDVRLPQEGERVLLKSTRTVDVLYGYEGQQGTVWAVFRNSVRGGELTHVTPPHAAVQVTHTAKARGYQWREKREIP